MKLIKYFFVGILSFGCAKSSFKITTETSSGRFSQINIRKPTIVFKDPHCSGCLVSLIKYFQNSKLKFNVLYYSDDPMEFSHRYQIKNKINEISGKPTSCNFIIKAKLDSFLGEIGNSSQITNLTPFVLLLRNQQFKILNYQSIFKFNSIDVDKLFIDSLTKY